MTWRARTVGPRRRRRASGNRIVLAPVPCPVTEQTIDASLTSTAPTAAPTAAITVYWRPGCPFCSTLRSGLRRAGLEFVEVDIWQDPDAAAFVRSVARGNETVPTVTIGDTSLVNPSVREVAAAVDAITTDVPS